MGESPTGNGTTPAWALPLHALAVVLIGATQTAVVFILSVLAQKRFDAGEWQVVIIQAAPTVCFVLSIFWNDYFERRTLARYLPVLWVVAYLPLAASAWATSAWGLIVPHVIASLGVSGYYPVAGTILRHLYSDRRRGSVYGLLYALTMAGGAAASYAVGKLLHADPESFRVYMPAASGLQLLGVALLGWLAHATGVSRSRRVRVDGDGARVRRLLDPIVHMGGVLKADPVFARYEAAYMTYGVGWMIAWALVPLMATRALRLDYDEFTNSTSVPYQVAIVAALLPAGWLMDRLGPVRSTAISFAMLALYPCGLIAALATGSARDLAITSVWYGAAHAGANIGWMLGPVALAPSHDKVPKYVAIHATLVGLRGAVFQGLGVALYKWTGRFEVPLGLAAAAYAWSAWQMWSLHGRVKARTAREESGVAVEKAVVTEAD